MFTLNDDLSIYATRGDIVFFSVTAEDKGAPYMFKAGDVVRIKVYGKKDAENVVLQKDFPVTKDCTDVEIFLTEEDTKIGEVISKPKDYWYEVELNPYNNPQTIIGYDDDGAKVFKLFPEGDDVPEWTPEPEDISVMDDELDMTSTKPVQNQAIARAVTSLRADFEKTDNLSNETAKALSVERERLDILIAHAENANLSQGLEYLGFISEETRAKIDAHIDSDGVFATIKVNLREANLIYGGTELDVFIIPNECRPIDTGVIHSYDGLDYIVKYDMAEEQYYLSLRAHNDVTVAPSSAGSITFTYALGDYELSDIRVGVDGKKYTCAGDHIRDISNKSVVDLTFVKYPGTFITETGAIAKSDAFSLSDPVIVMPGEQFAFDTPLGNNYVTQVCFMNGEGFSENYIIPDSGLVIKPGEDGRYLVTVPDGAKEMYISVQIAYGVPTVYSIDKAYRDVTIPMLTEEKMLPGGAAVEAEYGRYEGWYMGINNTWVNNPSLAFGVSDPIAVKPGDVYTISFAVGNPYVKSVIFQNSSAPDNGSIVQTHTVESRGFETFIVPYGATHMFICNGVDSGQAYRGLPVVKKCSTNIFDAIKPMLADIIKS